MTTTQLHPSHAPLRTSVLASLVPWAAFLGATVLTDLWVDYKSASYGGLAASAPFYLGFVALPSLLPLAAARRGAMWIAVLVVMTAVAVGAGILIVTTDDAQAGLAVLWVPLVALPLAGVLWIGEAVTQRRTAAERPREAPAPSRAGLSDRLAALTIDVVILGAGLVAPLTAMSHDKHEVAAGVVAIGVATIYLGGLVSVRGGTIGQSLLGLAVVDASTGRRVELHRLLVRGVVVALEVAAAFTIILLPIAIAELMSASTDGRSLTDRLLRTRVVATR
jgi:hypothetical protein